MTTPENPFTTHVAQIHKALQLLPRTCPTHGTDLLLARRGTLVLCCKKGEPALARRTAGGALAGPIQHALDEYTTLKNTENAMEAAT